MTLFICWEGIILEDLVEIRRDGFKDINRSGCYWSMKESRAVISRLGLLMNDGSLLKRVNGLSLLEN